MRFEKWQALGNDYLIVEASALPWELTLERIRRLCEPHFGVGSDGVLLLSQVEDARQVAELRIFNPDGSEAELSGNGARQAALYLRHARWTDENEFSILTPAGEIRPTITAPDTATLAMGRASVTSPDYPSGGPDGVGGLSAGGRRVALPALSIGNPQCVIEAGEDVEGLDLAPSAPKSSTASCSRTAPTSRSSAIDDSTRPGPDLRARGGGDPVLRHRRERPRRWRPSLRARPARSR